MGWKTIKEHYKIAHTVQVTKEGICIGSPYVHNIVVINNDGKVVKGRNEDYRQIREWLNVILADEANGKLVELVRMTDVFDEHLLVWTFKNGRVFNTYCKEYGYPNCTHEGEIMYENTFFNNRADALIACKCDAHSGVVAYWRIFKERIVKNFKDSCDVTGWVLRKCRYWVVSKFQ